MIGESWRSIAHFHNHFVQPSPFASAFVSKSGACLERERPCRLANRELRRIGPAHNEVRQERILIIARRHRRHRRRILHHIHIRRCPAAIGCNHRRIVRRRHGHRHRQVGELRRRAIIGGANRDIINIVSPGIARILRVWRGEEREHASRGVDRETRRIDTAGKREDEGLTRLIGIAGVDAIVVGRSVGIERGRGVFHRGSRGRTRCEDRCVIVGWRDRDENRLRGIDADRIAVVRRDDHFVHVVACPAVGAADAIGRAFIVRRAEETELAGVGIDCEINRIDTAGDRVGDRFSRSAVEECVGIGRVHIVGAVGVERLERILHQRACGTRSEELIVVVLLGDGDVERLGDHIHAIAHLHIDHKDAIGIRIDGIIAVVASERANELQHRELIVIDSAAPSVWDRWR